MEGICSLHQDSVRGGKRTFSPPCAFRVPVASPSSPLPPPICFQRNTTSFTPWESRGCVGAETHSKEVPLLRGVGTPVVEDLYPAPGTVMHMSPSDPYDSSVGTDRNPTFGAQRG